MYPGAAPSDDAAIREMVRMPAYGLIGTAVLGGLLQIFSLLMNVMGAGMGASQGGDAGMQAMMSGTMGIVGGIVGLIMTGVIIYGAIKMMNLENHGLAMAAAVIAMIPCISPCCFIGLPVGAWAVSVLMKPEVKAAFR